jgi:hypothetical protein
MARLNSKKREHVPRPTYEYSGKGRKIVETTTDKKPAKKSDAKAEEAK